jgi:hypothetical protein
MTDDERQGSNPLSLAAKAAWLDPEYRIKMKLRDMQLKLDRKIDPEKFKRTNVPNGSTRAKAAKKWKKASALADRFIQIMTDTGQLAPDEDRFLDENGEWKTIPNDDAGMAKAALREAFKLAVGPTEQKTRVSAINTVLAYTKSKPESKSKLTLNKAEDFLDEIAGD